MSNTEFKVDEAAKSLTVTRTYDASVSAVWRAWTTQELLEKWRAPHPWQAVRKSFDFREGGHWHYCMAGPEGEKHWCWVDYLTIEPEKSFTAFDGFCDEQGVRDTNLPANDWKNEFIAAGDKTRVLVTLTFRSVEELNQIVEMGFKEGFTMGLDQLEDQLEKVLEAI